MTIRMKALRAQIYAGARIKPGEEFDVRGERDAKLLYALGRAERVVATAPAPAQKPVPAPEPAVDQAVDQAGEPIGAEHAPAEESAEQPKPKRAYRRRDMTAEGGE